MKLTNFRKKAVRANKGYNLAELAPALMVIFFVFVLPLINLGTQALRWGILLTAAREGAHAGAVSYTYQVGSSGKPAAITQAPAAVNEVVGKFNGNGAIVVDDIDIDILRTDINTQSTTRFENKLPAPADTTQYVYSIECSVTGTLQPLLPYTGPFLPRVEGMNAPLTVTVVGREFSEAPQGLDQ